MSLRSPRCLSCLARWLVPLLLGLASAAWAQVPAATPPAAPPAPPAHGATPAAGGAAANPADSAPDVQIVAFFDPTLQYASSVAYSTNVSEGQARDDAAALAQALGYEGGLVDLQPTDGEGKRLNLQYSQTDGKAELGFKLSERGFNREKGTFKLEAFLQAFHRYRRIHIDFSVGDLNGYRFVYRGLTDYHDKNVRIRYHGTADEDAYAFIVEILNPNYKKLDLPPYALPVAPLDAAGGDGSAPRRGPAAWLAALAGALGSGAVAFVALTALLRGRRRKRRPTRRGPAGHSSGEG